MNDTQLKAIAKALAKYPERSTRQIVHILWKYHVLTKDVESVRRTIPPAPLRPKPTPRLKTIQEFQKKFDYRAIVRAKIAEDLQPSSHHYFDNTEFRLRCNIPARNWYTISEDPEFAEYRLRHGSAHNYWAPPKMIADMKKILNIES